MAFLYRIKESVKHGLLLAYAHVAGRHSYIPETSSLPLIHVNDVVFYANTPNTIIRFNGERSGFFRECRMHTLPASFLESLFRDYCRYVFVNEHSEECFRYLLQFLKNEKSVHAFMNLGDGTAHYSRIALFRKNGDKRVIGFYNNYPQWFCDQLLQLVQFAWGPLIEYQYCRNLNYGEYHSFNSSKSYVSKALADALRIGELIPRSYYARLSFDGSERIGIVVESAKGIDPESIKGSIGATLIAPQFQKALSSLRLLDALCFQKDHRPGNYFISFDDVGRVSSVSAFDNDCPTTLFPSPFAWFKTYLGIPPLTNWRGEFQQPFFDARLYDSILALDKGIIKEGLVGLCSPVEISMVYSRLRSIRRALTRSVRRSRTALLKDNEWDSVSMKKELVFSKVLGQETYFTFFIKEYTKQC